ncbi:MAG: hypothetical protein ABUS56_13920 [Acidobacteriota bacterium]
MRRLGAVACFVAMSLLALHAETSVTFTPDAAVGDMLALFSNPAVWRDARGRIDTFKFYQSGLNTRNKRVSPNVLNAFVKNKAFGKLATWGIKIAIEAHFEGNYQGEGGTDHCPDDDSSARNAIRNVNRNGGVTDAIQMDEPYFYGVILDTGSGGCGYTLGQEAALAAKHAATIKSKFPGVKVGDIEPFPALSEAQLEAWVTAVIASGWTPDMFDLDVDQTRSFADADLATFKAFLAGKGIPFGIIIDQVGATTDAAFYSGSLSWMARMAKALGGLPDRLLFQSFACDRCTPAFNVPQATTETTANSHTRLVNEALDTYGATFSGAPTATSADGSISLSWPTATGTGPMSYSPQYIKLDLDGNLVGEWTSAAFQGDTTTTLRLPTGAYAFRVKAKDGQSLVTYSPRARLQVTAGTSDPATIQGNGNERADRLGERRD